MGNPEYSYNPTSLGFQHSHSDMPGRGSWYRASSTSLGFTVKGSGIR